MRLIFFFFFLFFFFFIIIQDSSCSFWHRMVTILFTAWNDITSAYGGLDGARNASNVNFSL